EFTQFAQGKSALFNRLSPWVLRKFKQFSSSFRSLNDTPNSFEVLILLIKLYPLVSTVPGVMKKLNPFIFIGKQAQKAPDHAGPGKIKIKSSNLFLNIGINTPYEAASYILNCPLKSLPSD